MCGIAGIFRPDGLPESSDRALIDMRDRLAHRGPDSAGLWIDRAAGIALGHRRLSVVDVSPNGSQPMRSPSGRFRIAFNGEIYNHRELRERAEGAGHGHWQGQSDTESLVAHIELFGLERTLTESVGMFAIALWDGTQRALHLARDRMGEKPLYYGWQGGTLLFGSELKSLRAHPSFESEIDREAANIYMRRGYVPAPYSVWRGVHKLLPGTVVTFSAAVPGQAPAPKRYWSLDDIALGGQRELFQGSDAEATSELERALRTAVAGQMAADVPLGAFLSGGIDSSTVVALMQAQSTRRVRTYSLGFEDAAHDESRHARAVATHLGTDHTEAIVTARDAQGFVPLLPAMFDEPFGDSSAVAAHLVAVLARRHVTVALSGDGGDELLGGYRRYGSTVRAHALAQRVPWPARPILFGGADVLASAAARVAGALPGAPRPLRQRIFVAALRARVMREVAESASVAQAYDAVVAQWPADPELRGARSVAARMPAGRDRSGIDAFHRLMMIDGQGYLPDDILTKVDRTAMSSGLETRVPMLDHRVVELAWRMPVRMKVRDGVSKWILRQVLARHVPPTLFERPKMGFGVPVGDWVRGPLHDWAETLLSERSLARDGLLPVERIRDGWRRHMRGEPGWRDRLWTVLMWQAWRGGT